jgi:TolB-like protein
MGCNIKNKANNSVVPRSLFVSVVFSLVLIFTCGCAASKTTFKYYVRPGFDVKTISKIAVLPIENFTNDGSAGDKISDAVITEILSRGIDVIEPGEISSVLSELKVKSISSIGTNDIQGIQKALGVDAVMRGSVDAYQISAGITAGYPEVTIHMTLIDAKSGSIVWSAWNTSGGAHFLTRHLGTEGPSLGDTVGRVVKDSIDSLFRK